MTTKDRNTKGNWVRVFYDLYQVGSPIDDLVRACRSDVGAVSEQCRDDVALPPVSVADRCMFIGMVCYVWHRMYEKWDGSSNQDVCLEMHWYDMDHAAGMPGLCHAMQRCGWLEIKPKMLIGKDLRKHFGKVIEDNAREAANTKKRREDASALSAECRQGVGGVSEQEKRREEKNTKTPPNPQGGTESGDDTPRKHKRLIPDYTEKFQQFWSQYPATRRVNKVGTFKIWLKQNIERTDKPTYDVLMRGLAAWNKCHEWTKEGGRFVCMPTTFLNQCRWSNQPPSAPQEVIQ